jgi:glycosyltransferase involved in cell wall biosynthesis
LIRKQEDFFKLTVYGSVSSYNVLTFSIIIPTLNSARHIKGAVESILSQDFSDFEVVIVDGESSDDTVGIIQSFADNRIKIFSGRDSGIYDAMNRGISRASGEYVYFLGSDDRLYGNDVLSRVATFLTGSDVVYGDIFNEGLNRVYDGEFSGNTLLIQNISHQAIFCRKTLFQKLGNFDTRFRIHADWAFNLKWFFSKEVSSKYIPVVIARYGPSGVSSSFTAEHFRIHKYIFQQFSFDETKIVQNIKSLINVWINKHFSRRFLFRAELYSIVEHLPTVGLKVFFLKGVFSIFLLQAKT